MRCLLLTTGVPLFNQRWQFSRLQVNQAPERAGVYVLWERYQPTYIGTALGDAATIRSELARLLDGAQAPAKGATHFSYGVSDEPKKFAEQVMADHLDMFGAWPRYNGSPD